MTDALTLFAGLIVAPAGVVIAAIVVTATVRSVRADWRQEFQPRTLSVHEQAAADLTADAHDAPVFARELAELANAEVAHDEDSHRLRCGALLALMDSRAMLADADALLQEHRA